MKTTTTILAVLLTACGPEAIVLGEGEISSETGETGDSSREPERGDPTETDGETETGGEPESQPEVDPGDGDGGDPACDYLGCPCAAGGCVDLVCDLSEHCSLCSPGVPGCPCGIDGHCDVGQCFTGEDTAGTSWSVCYPADLIGCAIDPCPGDAHCTDDLSCAWPT